MWHHQEKARISVRISALGYSFSLILLLKLLVMLFEFSNGVLFFLWIFTKKKHKDILNTSFSNTFFTSLTDKSEIIKYPIAQNHPQAMIHDILQKKYQDHFSGVA